MATNLQNLDQEEHSLPNGPVVAVMLAGGIAAAVLGLVTVLSEASAGFKTLMTWWNPAGAISGKTLTAMILFFATWIGLHFAFRGKEMSFNRAFFWSLGLLTIGLIGTFPPFFLLFAAK